MAKSNDDSIGVTENVLSTDRNAPGMTRRPIMNTHGQGEDSLCIGLFGTCGGSVWRDSFVALYDAMKINYFNPQVDDWTDEDAKNEASHLVNDAVVLFPITGETYGTGSLSETGFSVLQAIKLNRHRFFVVMIESSLDPTLDNPVARKESIRARVLVATHLRKLDLANLYIVDSLEKMQMLSIELYNIARQLQDAERYRSSST